MLRPYKETTNTYSVQKCDSCTELKPFQRRGATLINLLVALGQTAENVAIFLYSILDVPVQHSFIISCRGDVNMNNFQRFETKVESRSLTVLNTPIRAIDTSSYVNLRQLILVSCELTRITLGEMPALELLDVRFNRLESLPENIGRCQKLRTLRCANNCIHRIPREVVELCKSLVVLDCSQNMIKRITSQIVKCMCLRELEFHNNGLIELPMNVGLLSKLEVLTLHNNKLSVLPLSISSLSKLRTISFHSNPLQNIPVDFPQRPDDVRQYLQAVEQDPVPNTTVKLVLVGQEGVGKTTLLGALKRTFWVLPKNPNTPKTDGIDVKDIALDGMTLRCFDCGGDVDFYETHNFFITQGALYLACFNLSEYCLATVERTSFLLGRLQLWLQYIFSKVPSARVLIVGTHADHPALSKTVFEQIWEQLRALLVSARDDHRRYFIHKDRLHDCLLCQPDSKCTRKSTSGSTSFVNLAYDDATSLEEETSFNDGQSRSIAFPHIVGYYEVSSVKPVGNKGALNFTSNKSIEHLKDAIREITFEIIRKSPQLPRSWASVQSSLQRHVQENPGNRIISLAEVAKISKIHGVKEPGELVNMLQFLKAQGHVLYFPQLPKLENTVVLDPEWLAKIFSSVVSYKNTGISEDGFMEEGDLQALCSSISGDGLAGNMLTLLKHFSVCLKAELTTKVLFPSKLPLGEPDGSYWEAAPSRGQRQITYQVTFPSIIPPPFFSNLLVEVHRHGIVGDPDKKPAYFSNLILEWMKLDRIGCRSCKGTELGAASKSSPNNAHHVLFELLPHARTIRITARGPAPCCMFMKLEGVLRKVVSQFEGLGTIELSQIVCPGCMVQKAKSPHKYDVNALRLPTKPGEKMICPNAHIFPDATNILCGEVSATCVSYDTSNPRPVDQTSDYSGCPGLFLVLPISSNGILLDKDLKLFASSLMMDGYAAHFLCEFPDGYHITRTLGYRLKESKPFMEKYGDHIVRIMYLLPRLFGSSVSSQYGELNKSVAGVLSDLLKDYTRRFPACKAAEAQYTQAVPETESLHHQILDQGRALSRKDLREFLHIKDSPGRFGPLLRLSYGEQLLWLCPDHYKQMRVLTLGSPDPNIQAYVESNA